MWAYTIKWYNQIVNKHEYVKSKSTVPLPFIEPTNRYIQNSLLKIHFMAHADVLFNGYYAIKSSQQENILHSDYWCLPHVLFNYWDQLDTTSEYQGSS